MAPCWRPFGATPGLAGGRRFLRPGLTKTYRLGEVEIRRSTGRPRPLPRRVRRHARPSGSGKSTLLNILGASTFPPGDGPLPRPRSHERRRRRTDPVPARACRLRLPVLQPDSLAHRARERRAGDVDRRHPMARRRRRAVGRASARSFPRSSRVATARVAIARRSPSARTSCSATSRPARSTTRPGSWFWRFSKTSIGRSGPRSR